MHAGNCTPSFLLLQSNLTCSSFSASVVPAKSSLQTLFPPLNPFPLLFSSDGALSSLFYIKPPHFPGRSTFSAGNSLIYVETTGFRGDGHAVETMDATSQALLLPVKINLDEIDKLGNYESILPYWRLHILPSNVNVSPNRPWLFSFLQFNGIVHTSTYSDIWALHSTPFPFQSCHNSQQICLAIPLYYNKEKQWLTPCCNSYHWKPMHAHLISHPTFCPKKKDFLPTSTDTHSLSHPPIRASKTENYTATKGASTSAP